MVNMALAKQDALKGVTDKEQHRHLSSRITAETKYLVETKHAPETADTVKQAAEVAKLKQDYIDAKVKDVLSRLPSSASDTLRKKAEEVVRSRLGAGLKGATAESLRRLH